MTRIGTVALLFLSGPLWAQNVDSQPRFVVDTNVFCRAETTLNSASSFDVPLGSEIRVSRQKESGGIIWYFDVEWVNGEHPSCWVYGPATEAADGANSDRLRLAILDHILARKDAKLEDYVEVENFLNSDAYRYVPPTGARMPGLLGFRRLQLLDRAIATYDPLRDKDPLKRAWILSHRDVLEYDEPGGEWYVEPSHYWDIFEANKSEPWAEELAWFAVSLPTHTDECYSNCVLQQLVDRPLQYWTRYPDGPHIGEALATGADRAQVAVDGACEKNFPETDVPRDRLTEIRTSLAKVTDTRKAPILRSLDEIERKCHL